MRHPTNRGARRNDRKFLAKKAQRNPLIRKDINKQRESVMLAIAQYFDVLCVTEYSQALKIGQYLAEYRPTRRLGLYVHNELHRMIADEPTEDTSVRDRTNGRYVAAAIARYVLREFGEELGTRFISSHGRDKSHAAQFLRDGKARRRFVRNGGNDNAVEYFEEVSTEIYEEMEWEHELIWSDPCDGMVAVYFEDPHDDPYNYDDDGYFEYVPRWILAE